MTENRTAVVTGAGRGIGNAIACRLAQEGYAVAAADLAPEEQAAENLQKIASHGGPCVYLRGDISTAAGREEILQGTLSAFGRVDVLVNNAGVAPRVRRDILETTEDSLDFVLGVNLKGTFFLTQLVANEMIREKQGDPSRAPRIVNISSNSAYTSSVRRGEYCISKAGVSMITTLFADRLAEYGITVHEVRPGVIFTDMTAPVREKYDKMIAGGLTPIKRWGYPEDIADATVLLCSDRLAFSTGEIFNVDGGFHIRRL